jgi:succinate dehydrogenase / fumarate reductase cytochrome b subunit
LQTRQNYFSSSIGRKQTVAITGLALILFLVGHLAGNLLIYLGPHAYNGYAEKLAGLRPGLYVIEFGLLAVFLTHIHFTSSLVLENIRARSKRLSPDSPKGERSLATRIMPFTGALLIWFVIQHLLDFTFTAHNGLRSVLADGQDHGLFGLVYNSFQDPRNVAFYIAAMASVGFHLSHGIESTVQTLGFNHPVYTPRVRSLSRWLGFIIAAAYSSLPIAVYFNLVRY